MKLLPLLTGCDPLNTQAPRFLFTDINQQCNLKCKHCMLWARPEVELPGHISIERRSEIIAEFAELNPNGTVVICGGESMMNPERYFPITRQTRELGLNCFSVVNGTMINDDEMAMRMIAEGPSEVTVSVNSHRSEVHDRTRGRIGSFDLATGAIRLMLQARERLGASTAIYAMAVVCQWNYRELDEFYDYVLNDLGADKLKLNFLQPTFGPIAGIQEDKFYQENLVANEAELLAILRSCNEKYQLNFDPEWLRVVELYHKSVHVHSDAAEGWASQGTSEPICNSYERNIMLNMFGQARFCFSINFPGTKLKRHGDLRKFWYGNDRLRHKMAKCTAPCGISHSVRRVSATNKPLEIESDAA
ncbi:MAG: radical SAM protein [Planctomycetaceae bacterium]|nr:radical SAM protein [Planctomycetaceae bacterium]